MNIAIVGTGYVGLVGGACLAELGHRVRCVDHDGAKVAMLNDGKLPIYEPGLETLVPNNVERERLSFTTDLAAAVGASEVVYISVGTPMSDDGSADLTYVEMAAAGIGDAIKSYTLVVVKSTVPVGTCDRVREVLASRTDVPVDVVSNPEFLREGVAVPDFMTPDRIVVGSESARARELIEQVYAPLLEQGAPLFHMDTRSSELTKYASNAMLATRISFMNEIARLCEAAGADVENVRAGMGSDKRIGPGFLRAGVGYGGSCFPKDVQALMKTASDAGSEMEILTAVESVNAAQKRWMLGQVTRQMGTDLTGQRFAVWGLAFKPDTDDMREAPALTLIEGLLAAGAEVRVHDPVAHEVARNDLGDRVTYHEDPYGALEGADALMLITEWKVFSAPDWDRVRAQMSGRRIYDGRNLWSPETLVAAGFTYQGIGR